LTETNKFVIVFQFYNTTGCHLQKKVVCGVESDTSSCVDELEVT